MSMPYFVATAPKVTVLRSLASTAFGVRKVDYPDGVDAPELDHESHEPGYVAALQGKRVGGFARRFIRADVSIMADGGDKAPFSDVERVLDDAAKRTSGEFFLETEVASSGLGPWIPFVDFQVGDLARVEVFGTPVVLPVTRIAPGVDDAGHESWTVHLGGQLVSDEQARLAESEQIRRNVDESWRELANVRAEAAKANARAEQAERRAVEEAEVVREESRELVESERVAREESVTHLRGVLTGAGGAQADLVSALEGLNQQLRRNGSDPAPGLIPAYLQMNTELWQMQQEVNDALRKADEALVEGQESNRELIKIQQTISETNREHLSEIEQSNRKRDQLVQRLQEQERQTRAQRIQFFSSTDRRNEHWSINGNTLTANGSWIGEGMAVSTYRTRVVDSASTDSRGDIDVDYSYIDGANTHNLSISSGSRSFTVGSSSTVVWYRVTPGQVRELLLERRNFNPPSSSWIQVDAFNVQFSGQHTIQSRVVWDAVHRGANYRFRVTVDGRTVVQDSSGTSWGPLFPWENGARSREADLVNVNFRAGQRVVFEVQTDAGKSSQRAVYHAFCRVSWIDD